MNYHHLIEEIHELESRTDGLYIYGAGYFGTDLYRILTGYGFKFEGFLVTKKTEENEACGLPIYQADELMLKKIGIVIGLGDFYAEEVRGYLRDNGVDAERIVDGGAYYSKSMGKFEERDHLSVEITTVIGCRVNCNYCPQNVLISGYFRDNPSRQHIMTIQGFKKILENTPQDSEIMFAGMAEPFLNRECKEMIRLACEAGRYVSLYTTLEGADDDDMEAMLSLPIDFFVLHIADKQGFAKITLSEEYYQRVAKLITAKKRNGKPLVDTINAQTDPDDRIIRMCGDKFPILTSMNDRAGNLENENLHVQQQRFTSERICCCNVELNTPVVLPDGTLLLCDMDFGMKHVLGNLMETHYNLLRKSDGMKKVITGMSGDTSVDLLCRKCIKARLVK